MNVKNRKCIRKLSLKSLYANRRRNLIAIFAIALTTLLFTSMFTIVLSLNASYETYQFRQVGGYAHGTFKDVSPEQAERIAAHPKVKAAGIRKVIGITAEGVFAKVPAEISYMDANCTKWSYATPTTGRMPESGKEVAMDTAALQLLGVTPELGAEVTVSYSITDKDQTAFTVTDTFTLVGYWDYDELMPVHYINISRDYWMSYVAQYYDLNFKETWQIMKEKNYISRIIKRLEYKEKDTREKMEILEQQMNAYMYERIRNKK